jgi:hypothetical protein
MQPGAGLFERVGGREIAILERKIFGKKMPQGRVIALTNEIGISRPPTITIDLKGRINPIIITTIKNVLVKINSAKSILLSGLDYYGTSLMSIYE